MRHRVRDKRERNMYESCGFKTAERLTHYHVKFKLHARCFMPFLRGLAWGPRARWVMIGGFCKEHQQYHSNFHTKTLICYCKESRSFSIFYNTEFFFLVSVKIKCVSLVASKTSLLVYEDKKIALRILMNIGTKLCAWATETWIHVNRNSMSFLV